MNIFFERKFVIQAIVAFVAFMLLAKLFYIQVIDNSYNLSANNNVLRKLIIYPARGVISDRNGVILVQNEPVYDLMVIPRQVKNFDTVEFCRLIGISKNDFLLKFEKARRYSKYKASVFEKQLSSRTYAGFQEKLFEYQGFYVQNRSVRRYPNKSAPHILGYIGEVNEKMIAKSGNYYKQGDYVGISGIEQSYEKELKGQRGIKNIMVDVFNREKGSYENGRYDTIAIAGERLMSSLDAVIQEYGERLMQNKKGSIVAIEPSTGEILAFISSPTYDPNLLVGRDRSKNYSVLLEDKNIPLFIRPTMAQYPPGSIFKIINALLEQKYNIITRESTYPCNGAYFLGGLRVGCRPHPSPVNLPMSLQWSCNSYNCNYFNALIQSNQFKNSEEGFNAWRSGVNNFGIGKKLDIDLPNELKGLLPTAEQYNKIYGKGSWKGSTIISLSIGQGELGITPLQMANLAAIVANRGFYYNPHLIKAIGKKKIVKPEYTKKNYVGIDAAYFEPVIDGMDAVVQGGTAGRSRINNIIMCGKTGTVQVPNGEDHSVFIAFAPRDNPKIAIAVVIENAQGGGGSTWAAPLASLLVEKYLTDSITKPKAFEDRILNARFINDTLKLPLIK